MAFRIIVDDVARLLPGARACIHGRYPVVPGRFKDYISTPKPNGYRSLHTGVIGPERPAHRDADPHRRDARGRPSTASPRTGSTSRADRRPTRRSTAGCASCSRSSSKAPNAGGVPRAHQARDVPGPGLLLHAQGRPDRAAARRDAGRFRLCGAQPGRRHLRRRQDQRPDAAAAHPAAERRPGRDHHLEGADAVADLGALRRHRQGAGPHPPLHPHAAARAVPRARPLAAREGVPRRKATSSPRRALEGVLKQLQAGDDARRPVRQRRRRPVTGARGRRRGLPRPQAAARSRDDKVVPISRAARQAAKGKRDSRASRSAA